MGERWFAVSLSRSVSALWGWYGRLSEGSIDIPSPPTRSDERQYS